MLFLKETAGHDSNNDYNHRLKTNVCSVINL